ncbi:MAG: DUF1700 domain-containing protein [Actinobacteria bacterium]|nr:DUF1700 domain-containing protein [Actinomycetota bacterium]MBM3709316.1 DUF1700 domain-containing protein [Actinomycetota bacterium]
MNKKKFLDKLAKNLKGLPNGEIEDIFSDFVEYFEIGKEKGRSEEELLSSLGDPKILARQIKTESYIKKAEETTSAANITRAVFTSIGLSFFNIIFTLPLFIAVNCVLGALFAVSVSLSATGITGVLGSLFYPLFSQYLSFMVNPAAVGFAFLGLCSFGVLFFVGVLYLSKLVYRFIVKYLKFNLNIIRGRRQQGEI